ncbi:MAG: amidohydrolase [Clostridium sp.]|nr:amidohydrolase [Clostridium sp.]
MGGERYENGYVDAENGKITAFGSMNDAPVYSGETYDAEGGYILPGLIDAHTHIGISEEGLRWEGEDCNEATDPVTPYMRAVDGINPFDTAIPKARRAGITTVAVSPGSTNVIGGQIAAIKLIGKNVDNMVIKAPCAIKFALGENPKRTYGDNKGRSPMTRMATAAIMRKTLMRAQRYMNKKEAGEDIYEPDMEALIPLLKREIPAHFHAHRADDILTAIRIAHEFNLKYCILHATGAEKITDCIKDEHAVFVVGPSMGPAGKPETVGGSFATAGVLTAAGMEVAITTDHDVTPLWLLPSFAAMCVREGMNEYAALQAITIIPAKALGIDACVGSIKVGKDADIVVFTGHPFNYLTEVRAVFINGVKVE